MKSWIFDLDFTVNIIGVGAYVEGELNLGHMISSGICREWDMLLLIILYVI